MQLLQYYYLLPFFMSSHYFSSPMHRMCSELELICHHCILLHCCVVPAERMLFLHNTTKKLRSPDLKHVEILNLVVKDSILSFVVLLSAPAMSVTSCLPCSAPSFSLLFRCLRIFSSLRLLGIILEENGTFHCTSTASFWHVLMLGGPRSATLRPQSIRIKNSR